MMQQKTKITGRFRYQEIQLQHNHSNSIIPSIHLKSITNDDKYSYELCKNCPHILINYTLYEYVKIN